MQGEEELGRPRLVGVVNDNHIPHPIHCHLRLDLPMDQNRTLPVLVGGCGSSIHGSCQNRILGIHRPRCQGVLEKGASEVIGGERGVRDWGLTRLNEVSLALVAVVLCWISITVQLNTVGHTDTITEMGVAIVACLLLIATRNFSK